MAYNYTDTDINDRLVYTSYAISYLADIYSQKQRKGILNVCDKRKLIVLSILFDIAKCYEPYAVGGTSTNCLSEEDMDNIFEAIETIGNICFDAKGKTSV